MDAACFYANYARPVLRLIFVTLNNLYCIPTYALWCLLLLPLVYWNPSLYWSIEKKLFKWLLAMVAAWGWTAGYTIEEVGEDVSSCFGQESLIVVNHQSTGDVPLLMGSFLNKGDVVPNMMWLMDRVFKFTNFGLVSFAHGDFFIRSGKNVRQNELDNLKRHLIEVYTRRRRKWLILFPEGGFLHKRKATSQKYAKANNLPDLERVSLPRLGAMHTILQTLNPIITEAQSNHTQNNSNHKSECNAVNSSSHRHKMFEDGLEKKDTSLKWVIDITIAYPHAEPLGLLTLCTGSRSPCKTILHFRRYPIEEVPRTLDAMTKWLYDRWVEKEHMLDEFYERGQFPIVKSPNSKLLSEAKPVMFNNYWLISLHIFFITSTLCHCYLLCSLFSLIW